MGLSAGGLIGGGLIRGPKVMASETTATTDIIRQNENLYLKK